MAVPPTAAPASIKLRRQVALCTLMCALAWLLMAAQGTTPAAALTAGHPLHLQAGFGLAVGILAALAAWTGYKWQASRPHRESAAAGAAMASYNRLDLSGSNPLWISLGAGVGEELLFRGALQPALGIVLSSMIFLIAHLPAYQMKSFTRTTAVQAAGVFATSLFLALVCHYVGLVAAMLVHTLIDIVALYTIRQAALEPAGIRR